MEQDFGYYAVIPLVVLHDNKLRPTAKLLYGQISSLTKKEGYCYASNEKLSTDIGIAKRSVENIIKELEKAGYIQREIIREDGKNVIRKIYILSKNLIATTPSDSGEVNAIGRGDTPSDSGFALLDKSLDKRIEIQSIKDAYAYRINKNSRLTEGAKTKIKARLKTYTLEELTKAIEKFSQDEWWMEKNSHQGLEWFFRSDAQIDKFLNLKTVKKTEMKYV